MATKDNIQLLIAVTVSGKFVLQFLYRQLHDCKIANDRMTVSDRTNVSDSLERMREKSIVLYLRYTVYISERTEENYENVQRI